MINVYGSLKSTGETDVLLAQVERAMEAKAVKEEYQAVFGDDITCRASVAK